VFLGDVVLVGAGVAFVGDGEEVEDPFLGDDGRRGGVGSVGGAPLFRKEGRGGRRLFLRRSVGCGDGAGFFCAAVALGLTIAGFWAGGDALFFVGDARAGVLIGEDLVFAGEPFFPDEGGKFLLALAVLAFLSAGEARAGEDVC
jgi:hypothetical protein